MDGISCFVLAILAVATCLSSPSANVKSRFLDYNFPSGAAVSHRRLQHRSIASSVRESCLKFSENPVVRVNTTDRLRRLRLRMKASNYDAYIIPSSDEHESEFVSEHDKRRQFISGFSGSAGTAVVLQEVAALWTDGRYFLQAENELDCNWLLMKRGEEKSPSSDEWIIQKLNPGSKIGADSKLIPHYKWNHFRQKFEQANLTFHADDRNLIDDIWNIPQGRAPESVSHVIIHDVKYAGKPWYEKIEEVKNIIHENNASGTVITALDDIACRLYSFFLKLVY